MPTKIPIEISAPKIAANKIPKTHLYLTASRLINEQRAKRKTEPTRNKLMFLRERSNSNSTLAPLIVLNTTCITFATISDTTTM
ncbi:MAG TPA: hypothetical protein VJX95_00725, partial [Oscillospiraceae bacterium]|nr:hypothetical protein [Oscillospiraceae bacterium]